MSTDTLSTHNKNRSPMKPEISPGEHDRGAPLWRRFAALFYDSLIWGGLSMTYGAAVTALYVALDPLHAEYTPMFKGPLFFSGWLGVILLFNCGFWWKSGQTIGMRAWKIRLVALPVSGGVSSHNPLQLSRPSMCNPSFGQALVRSGCALLSFCLGGAGYFYSWFNADNDCWHDRVTRTRVILIR